MFALTEQQARLHDYISDRVRRDNIAPSYQEMADHMGLNSKSGVHRMVDALIERGYVQRIPGKSRALKVFDRPKEMTGDVREARKLLLESKETPRAVVLMLSAWVAKEAET